jgi:hypothetical protein
LLSIGKLARGADGHYLRAVASGVVDYYPGFGEAPGQWIGPLAADSGFRRGR